MKRRFDPSMEMCATVAINYQRNEASAKEVVQEIERMGERSGDIYQADVSDRRSDPLHDESDRLASAEADGAQSASGLAFLHQVE